jgi:hypothetical protein
LELSVTQGKVSTMDDDKSFKSFHFNGKSEAYMMWTAKILAYAQMKGFRGILEGTTAFPLDISGQ